MTLLYQNKMKAGFIMLCVLYSLTTVVSPSTGGSLPHSGETDKIVNCNNNIECYPSGVSNLVSSSLIMCKNNGCVCNECFTKNITTGQCTYTVPSPTYCYYYEEEDDECVDNRKSQLAAFVLSLTLSGFGVANFYIGQNVLGTTQLLLFLGLLIVTCCVCSSLCIVYGCMDCQGICVGIFCFIVAILFIVPMLIAIWAWWIADAVIFGMNHRTAGDGCPLKHNL